MRKVASIAVLLLALVLPLSAAARPSAGHPRPDGAKQTVSPAPAWTVVRVASATVPRGGVGAWPGGQRQLAGPYPACFQAGPVYSGPSDWSGYAHENGDLYWCSNGFWITYAKGGTWPTSAGMYSITYENGAWWCGGGVQQQTISLCDYLLWHWSPPLSFSNNGTTHLTMTGTYSGSFSQ